MKHPVMLTAGLAAALAAGPVSANDCAAPGQSALDAGQFAQAVTAFEIALENPSCGNDRDALTLGLATAMHRLAEAEQDGRRYCDAKQKYILAAESIEAGIAEKGKAGVAAVTAACDEAWKGSLTVECPSGAEAFIERLGGAKACPAKFEGIKAGTYQGELRGDGRTAPFIAAVTPGADVTVKAEFPPEGVAGGSGISTWAWVTAGVAVAAFAGAGVASLSTQTIADQAKRPENAGDFETLKDDHATQATVHYALLGTGVVLAGVATWLFLDSDDGAPAEGASAVITPEGLGFGWRGSW